MARITTMRVVCLLLLLVQTSLVQGSCYAGESYFDEGKRSTYCIAGTTRIEENSWYLTPDCFNCTCSVRGMSCCGVGIQAGSIKAPKGIKIQLVPPCDYAFVAV